MGDYQDPKSNQRFGFVGNSLDGITKPINPSVVTPRLGLDGIEATDGKQNELCTQCSEVASLLSDPGSHWIIQSLNVFESAVEACDQCDFLDKGVESFKLAFVKDGDFRPGNTIYYVCENEDIYLTLDFQQGICTVDRIEDIEPSTTNPEHINSFDVDIYSDGEFCYDTTVNAPAIVERQAVDCKACAYLFETDYDCVEKTLSKLEYGPSSPLCISVKDHPTNPFNNGPWDTWIKADGYDTPTSCKFVYASKKDGQNRSHYSLECSDQSCANEGSPILYPNSLSKWPMTEPPQSTLDSCPCGGGTRKIQALPGSGTGVDNCGHGVLWTYWYGSPTDLNFFEEYGGYYTENPNPECGPDCWFECPNGQWSVSVCICGGPNWKITVRYCDPGQICQYDEIYKDTPSESPVGTYGGGTWEIT